MLVVVVSSVASSSGLRAKPANEHTLGTYVEAQQQRWKREEKRTDLESLSTEPECHLLSCGVGCSFRAAWATKCGEDPLSMPAEEPHGGRLIH